MLYEGRMAPLKQKGDTAELAVALDLRRRGYRICFPYGEDSDYDLIVEKTDLDFGSVWLAPAGTI